MRLQQKRRIAVAFLAKGRSDRLGTVKALLPFDGETILGRLISEFSGETTAVITSEPESFAGVPAEVVSDYAPRPGPVGAIYTALAHFQPLDVLVIPADMPFIRNCIVAPLVSALPGKHCALFEIDSKIQPFPSLFSAAAITPVAAALKKNSFSMSGLLEGLDKSVVSFSRSLPGEDPGNFFLNINTREDYRELLAAGKSNSSHGEIE